MPELNTSAMLQTLSMPGTYHLVEGEAEIPKGNLLIANATFQGLLSYVKVREVYIEENKANTHLRIDSANQKVTLYVEEYGAHRNTGGTTVPSVTITGSAKFSEDHLTVKAMMGKKWSAHELGMHIRGLRHLFPEEGPWVEMVNRLRTMKMRIEHVTEDVSTDLGAKKKSLETEITKAEAIFFVMRYSIHNDSTPVDVRIDVAYDVKGSSVELGLISVNLVKMEREAVEAMMQATVEKLRSILHESIPFIGIN